MGREDWAIIVGVQSYPELGDLEGPENDAGAFRDWILSPGGGDIPQENVEFIVTSQFSPPFSVVDLAKPTAERVHQAVEKLQNIAVANEANGRGRRVGRRLYIYMAGHGFAPRDDQTALLMANATRLRVGSGFHILGQYTADWFFKAGYFNEIALFMDCCRESYSVPGLDMPYREMIATDNVDRQRFFGFGTKWSRLSRERPIDGGVVRGVFTQVLLEGLYGAACEPNSGGQVTADSLRNYLIDEKIWQTFLAPQDLSDPNIPKRPDVPNLGTNFLLATIKPPPQYPVILHFTPGSLGKIVDVLDGKDFRLVDSTVIAENLEWRLPLERGTYLAEICADRVRTPIVVGGKGETHVCL